MIAGKDAFKPGEAKNSWLTGTAAWNFLAISQYILGIQPNYGGLVVNPCIPNEWSGFNITRRFRGTTFKIDVQNPNHVSKGVKELWIDGIKTEGNKISIQNKNECKVIVVMG